MKYTIENQKLELDVSLSKSSAVIQESADQMLELEFSGLRKKTAEELFTIGFRNNRLFIKENSARHSPMLDALFNANLASDVIIRIPAQTSVAGKIATIKGDIKVGKLDFHGEIKTVTGKIVADDITTDSLNVQNIGGSVFIGKIAGFLKGRTVAGEFTVESGVFKELAISSVSGDVRLAGNFQLEEDGEISTVSGNIHLNIDEFRDQNVLTLSTLSGSSSLVGEYPEGAIVIKPRMPFLKHHPFKSFMPSMKDMFSSFFSGPEREDAEVEVKAETVPDDNENTKMILEMLSQGKITVEEAEKLIKALGGK